MLTEPFFAWRWRLMRLGSYLQRSSCLDRFYRLPCGVGLTGVSVIIIVTQRGGGSASLLLQG